MQTEDFKKYAKGYGLGKVGDAVQMLDDFYTDHIKKLKKQITERSLNYLMDPEAGTPRAHETVGRYLEAKEIIQLIDEL